MPALRSRSPWLLLALVASAPACAAELGAWRDYATASLAPDFSWAERAEPRAVTPTVLSMATGRTAGPSLRFAPLDARDVLSIGIARDRVGDTPLYEDGGLRARTLAPVGAGIERTLIAPTLTTRVGDGRVSGSLILAHQQFATWGLGSFAVEDSDPLANPAFRESAFGTGVRLSLRQPLNDVLGFTTSVQSRIDMDAFQTYRGVFSEPGDFDLPAFASAGLEWRAGRTLALGVDVTRVFYSDTSPFTSIALPTRFLSLLGDGGSPEFGWNDLTVYALEARWEPTALDTLALRYTSQQQPEPSSRLLREALADEFTDRNIAVSWMHRASARSTWRIAASYAPSQYFLGNASYRGADGEGDQLELEATWTVSF